MTFVRTLAVGLLALAIQSGCTQAGIPPYVLPQLVLLVVVRAAFSESSVQATAAVFLLGLLTDLSSAVLVGPWAGAFVTVYAGLTLLSQRLFVDSGIAAACISFIATLCAGLFFSFMSPHCDLLVWQHALQLFGQATATALVAPWVMAILSHLSGRGVGSSLRSFSPLSTA